MNNCKSHVNALVKKNGIPEEHSTLKTLGILKLYYFNYNHCRDLFLFEDKTGARGTLWSQKDLRFNQIRAL